MPDGVATRSRRHRGLRGQDEVLIDISGSRPLLYPNTLKALVLNFLESAPSTNVAAAWWMRSRGIYVSGYLSRVVAQMWYFASSVVCLRGRLEFGIMVCCVGSRFYRHLAGKSRVGIYELLSRISIDPDRAGNDAKLMKGSESNVENSVIANMLVLGSLCEYRLGYSKWTSR